MVNFPHLRVLIRCDGTTSRVASIQIPGRLSRLDEGKDFAYLVDIADFFSPWAAKRSEDRERIYQEQGWIKTKQQEMIDDLSTKSGNQSDDSAGGTADDDRDED